VARIEPAADVRGREALPTVWIRPSEDGDPTFPPLDIDANTDALWSRVVEAGLAPQLPKRDAGISPVVLAADADVDVSSTQALLASAPDRAVTAAAMLGRLFASKATLAVANSQVALVETAAAARGIALLPLGDTYPQRLPRAVASHLGTADGLFPLRRAYAVLEVIERGAPPREAWVDLYAGEAQQGTWRVPVGIKLRDLLARVGVEPTAGDCVIVGGALRGFAQHSLDAPVDYDTDAIRYLPQPDYREWSDNPCVNCGSCIDVCPVALQVHMIGRLAEFGRFEDTLAHHLDACLDCGLCAMACPAHRPLLQWIRLARQQTSSAGDMP
jgi:electron transport complex protein RnfC